MRTRADLRSFWPGGLIVSHIDTLQIVAHKGKDEFTVDANIWQDQLPPIAFILAGAQGPFPPCSPIGTAPNIQANFLSFLFLGRFGLGELLSQLAELSLCLGNLLPKLVSTLGSAVHHSHLKAHTVVAYTIALK